MPQPQKSLHRLLLIALLLLLTPIVQAQGTPADAYRAALGQELAAKYRLPPGVDLLGQTEQEVAGGFHLIGPAAPRAAMRIIPVDGQPFTRAVQADITEPDATWWHVMFQALNTRPVRKGDALLACFWVRGRVPHMGGSEAEMDVFVKSAVAPYPEFTTIHLTANDHWQRFFLPAIAPQDCAPGEFQLGASVGYQRQQVEIGGASVLDFGPGVRRADLPRPAFQRFTYVGRAPDAPWRKAARARIERIRKAPLVVRVVDGRGRPVPGASVRVMMTRHAFGWGTSLVPSYDLLPPASQDPLRRQALPVMFRLFNQASVDMDLKLPGWYTDSEAQKRRVLQSLRVLKDHGMTVHAHVLFWPSFDYNEPLRKYKGDPKMLHEALRAEITDVVTRTVPYADAWDVLNEAADNHEMTDLLGGRPVIAEWFRLAHRLNPRARLYVNDYGLAEGGETAKYEAHRAFDEALIRDLQGRGAPVGGVGMQCHFNAPRDPARTLATWDRFARLGLPISVTEFDAKFGEYGDPQDEADFVRDFTLAAFSHPAVTDFTMWGYCDAMHWLHHAPLYDGDMRLKPSGRAWMDLVYHQWWTRAGGRTDRAGRYTVRGFLGDYRITVTAAGRSRTVAATLGRHGPPITLTLPQ